MNIYINVIHDKTLNLTELKILQYSADVLLYKYAKLHKEPSKPYLKYIQVFHLFQTALHVEALLLSKANTV